MLGQSHPNPYLILYGRSFYFYGLSMGTNCFDSSAELYTAHSTPNHPCNPDPNLYLGNMQYQWVRVISIHQLNREKDWKKCS